MKDNLYALMYIQRDPNSPFHDINKVKWVKFTKQTEQYILIAPMKNVDDS
jgi:hypothetical protein